MRGDARLRKVFSVIPLNPERVAGVDRREAERFVSWLCSAAAQRLIADFGVDAQGEPLFVPCAPPRG